MVRTLWGNDLGMDNTTVAWTVVVVLAALVVIALVLWNARRQRETYRRAQTEELREQLRREDVDVRERESVVTETQARARAAQAEAAEAERLQNAAESHRNDVRREADMRPDGRR